MKTSRRNRGFSLIELLIALFVMVTLVLAVAGVAVVNIRSLLYAEQKAAALELANERIDYIRSLPYQSVGLLISDDLEGELEPVTEVEVGSNLYTVRTDVAWADAQNTHKYVRVAVAWRGFAGGSQETVMHTYVADRSPFYSQIAVAPDDEPPPDPDPVMLPEFEPIDQQLSEFADELEYLLTPKFTIVVINSHPAVSAEQLQTTYANTINMVNTIDPWATYKKDIVVKKVETDIDLECEGGFPGCPNFPHVWETARNVVPEVSAVVVATHFSCNCGSVYSGPVAAVGYSAISGVVAHELGHAVGKLADEYFLGLCIKCFTQTGDPGQCYYCQASGLGGPNCFADQNSCQEAIANYPSGSGAICSQGCNNVWSWRPATRIMYSLGDTIHGQHGPLQACYVARGIERYVSDRSNKFCAR